MSKENGNKNKEWFLKLIKNLSKQDIILAIIIVIFLIPIVFLFIDIFFCKGCSRTNIIISYLNIIVSWPIIILLISLIFIPMFRQEISRLIDRIKSGSAGPLSFTTEAQSPENIEATTSNKEEQLMTSPSLYVEKIKLENLGLAKNVFFERVYNKIFKSQIALLRQLNITPFKLSWLYIYAYSYPKNMWSSYRFDIYMDFLKNSGLIQHESQPELKEIRP